MQISKEAYIKVADEKGGIIIMITKHRVQLGRLSFYM